MMRPGLMVLVGMGRESGETGRIPVTTLDTGFSLWCYFISFFEKMNIWLDGWIWVFDRAFHFKSLLNIISRCWLGLLFNDPGISWCLTGPDYFPQWGPNLSWAVFICGRWWFWFPDTLGKHSFVRPSFLVDHLTGPVVAFLFLVIINHCCILIPITDIGCFPFLVRWWPVKLVQIGLWSEVLQRSEGLWSPEPDAQLWFQDLYFPATWPWAIYLIFPSFIFSSLKRI